MSKSLSKVAKELTHHEAIIDDGMKGFLHVGKSLIAIRDGQLYEERFESFEAYCKSRWNISRPRAYQLIEAAEVTAEVSTIVDTKTKETPKHPTNIAPQNEAQARALAGSGDTPEQRREVWAKAVETAPKNEAGEPVITAKHIAKVADEVVGPKVTPPKPEQPKAAPVVEVVAEPEKPTEYGAGFDPRKFDERMADDPADEPETTGEIPAHLVAVIAGVKQYKTLQREVSLLMSKVHALIALPVGSFIRHQEIEMHIDQVKADLKVWGFGDTCPTCKNKPDAKCQRCKGRGWIAQGQMGTLSDWDKEWLQQNSVNRSK